MTATSQIDSVPLRLVSFFLPCLLPPRARHVKCDEEKPACNQCRKTGRICEGYGGPTAIEKPAVPSLLYTKVRCQPIEDLAIQYYGFLQTQEQRHSYDYFLNRTSKHIYLAFNGANHVHQLMLQASHSNPTVKLMVLAIGAVGEHLDSRRISGDLVPTKKTRWHDAHSYYIRAVAEFRKDMTSQDRPATDTIMISCFLLTIFDFLRGEEHHARIHLRAGLDILRRCYNSILANGIDDGQIYQDSEQLALELARIFSVMDQHAAMWLGSAYCCSTPILPHALISYPINFEVTNLCDVSTSLNFQIQRAHIFHHQHSSLGNLSPLSTIPFYIQAERSRLLYDLKQWPSTLALYLSTMPSLTPQLSRRVALMRMNYHSIFIFLQSMLQSRSPSFFASFTPNFASIISEAKIALQCGTSPNGVKELLRAIAENCGDPDTELASPFAFAAGSIQPLYLTATKCQGVEMREEAIAWLERDPWREGAWDSATMARFARKQWEM